QFSAAPSSRKRHKHIPKHLWKFELPSSLLRGKSQERKVSPTGLRSKNRSGWYVYCLLMDPIAIRSPLEANCELSQRFIFDASKLIGFLPAASSFAFNAASSLVLSASHFCSDTSSMPLSLVYPTCAS